MPPIKHKNSETLINGDVHDIILELRDNPFSFLQNHPKSGPDLIRILIMSTLELDRLYQLAWESDGADFPEPPWTFRSSDDTVGSTLEQIGDYVREYEEAITQYNQQPDLRAELRLINPDTDIIAELRTFLENYGDEEVAAGELLVEETPTLYNLKLELLKKYVIASDATYELILEMIHNAPQENFEHCLKDYMFNSLVGNQGEDNTALWDLSRGKTTENLFDQLESNLDNTRGDWAYNLLTEEGRDILKRVQLFINGPEPEDHGL